MKRPPGRPPLDRSASEPSADVHLTLPARDYDKAAELARTRKESIQDVIRLGLRHLLVQKSQ